MRIFLAAVAISTATLVGAQSAEAGVTLTSLDPAVLDVSGQSINGRTQAGIVFINDLNFAVDVYWINYSGSRVFYHTIAGGEFHVQQTYLTHPWIVLTSGTGTLAQGTGKLLDGFMAVSPAPILTAATVDYAYIRGAYAPTPEAGTWALLILGFGGAGVAIRKSQRVSPPLLA